MHHAETIQCLQQIIADQATELQQLKAELRLYKPVIVVAASGKLKQASKVTDIERQHRIEAINWVAKLPMFSNMQHNTMKKLARYMETCEAGNKIDQSITIDHFK